MKAVIFDMDGTIIDSMPIHFKIWQEVLAKFGYNLTKDFFDKLNGMNTPKIAKYLHDNHIVEVDPDLMAKEKRKISGEQLLMGVPLFPGVVETLNSLKSAGYKLGLATMTAKDHVELSLGENMHTLPFEKIVTDSDVENPKPAPDIFMKCAEELGVDYKDCVVVEDSLNGIKAAKAAGMKAVAITNTTPAEKFTDADRVINHITEVNDVFVRNLFD